MLYRIEPQLATDVGLLSDLGETSASSAVRICCFTAEVAEKGR
jgi:hypothetical protein